MNYKAIFKNIKNKGIDKVLKEIINKKKYNIRYKKYLKRFDTILNLMDNSNANLYKLVYMIKEQLKLTHEFREYDNIGVFLDMLKEKENENYKKVLRETYIKEILPKEYRESTKDIKDNKVVFLQPRRKVNQSFKYIYKKLKSEKKYKVKFCELSRFSVSDSEYFFNALNFVKELSDSRALFLHDSTDLIGYLDINKNTKVIQLWHGCGIIKKLGLSLEDKKIYRGLKIDNQFPEDNKYDIVTTASPEVSWIFEDFMGIKKESNIIQSIGVSRTDVFFDKEYLNNCYKKLYDKIPLAENKKIILYAPTYRGIDPNRYTPNQLKIDLFKKELHKDYILIVKHHQTAKNIPKIPDEYTDFAYDMTKGKGMDINELMSIADIMITDYSSVVFEYSLFERPMIFYAFDLDEYIDERGLYYNYDEITPGPIVKTNEEIINYIKDINNRFNKQEVINFKEKFMNACDGKSTERIIEWINNK